MNTLRGTATDTLRGIPAPRQQPYAIRYVLRHYSDVSIVFAIDHSGITRGEYRAWKPIAEAMYEHCTKRGS